MYEQILNDVTFRDMMTQIENIHFITDGKWDWEHGLGHAMRVSAYVKKILTDLNCDTHTIELGIIAGLIHDIGLSCGTKEGHALESSKMANEFLKKYPIGMKDREIIAQAILDHSKGKNIQSYIGAALLLSDKLDVSHYRVDNSSIKDKTNNEIAKIKRVDIEIKPEDIWIYYKTDNSFDISVLKEWSKAITVPLKVADFLHKNCHFKINHENLCLQTFLN